MTTPHPLPVKPERVSEVTLESLHVMSNCCAIKGPLLRQLIDEIRDTRRLLAQSREALDAGAMHLEAGAISHRAVVPHKLLPKGEANVQRKQAAKCAAVNDTHAATLRRLAEAS